MNLTIWSNCFWTSSSSILLFNSATSLACFRGCASVACLSWRKKSSKNCWKKGRAHPKRGFLTVNLQQRRVPSAPFSSQEVNSIINSHLLASREEVEELSAECRSMHCWSIPKEPQFQLSSSLILPLTGHFTTTFLFSCSSTITSLHVILSLAFFSSIFISTKKFVRWRNSTHSKKTKTGEVPILKMISSCSSDSTDQIEKKQRNEEGSPASFDQILSPVKGLFSSIFSTRPSPYKNRRRRAKKKKRRKRYKSYQSITNSRSQKTKSSEKLGWLLFLTS